MSDTLNKDFTRTVVAIHCNNCLETVMPGNTCTCDNVGVVSVNGVHIVCCDNPLSFSHFYLYFNQHGELIHKIELYRTALALYVNANSLDLDKFIDANKSDGTKEWIEKYKERKKGRKLGGKNRPKSV